MEPIEETGLGMGGDVTELNSLCQFPVLPVFKYGGSITTGGSCFVCKVCLYEAYFKGNGVAR